MASRRKLRRMAALNSYRDKKAEKLWQPMLSRNHSFKDFQEVKSAFGYARNKREVRQIDRMIKKLLKRSSDGLVRGAKGQKMDWSWAMSGLGRAFRERFFPLSFYNACIGTKSYSSTSTYVAGQKVVYKSEMMGITTREPVIKEKTSYSYYTAMKLKLRWRVRLMSLLSAVWGIGYLGGYPPPHRFIIPEQRLWLQECNAWCGYNKHLGDSVLPRKIRLLRRDILCGEERFRNKDQVGQIGDKDRSIVESDLRYGFAARIYPGKWERYELDLLVQKDRLFGFIEACGNKPTFQGHEVDGLQRLEMFRVAESMGLVKIRKKNED